ncbi:unnamed protein product, partial [Discosporangium mesarthrocarpum]
PKYHLAEIEPEPQTCRDVLNSEYRDLWSEAMERELTELQSANAFSPTNLPPDIKTIGAKWIYKWKTDEMGIVTKAKARLVAKGYNKKLGVDYFETFAPAPPASTIRLLTAVANEQRLELIHFDVEQAFLHANIDEEVFVRLPPGCGDLSGKTVRLHRALYGCKKSSRAWNMHLTATLKSFGFEQFEADPCLFRYMDEEEVPLLVVTHVDDMIAAGS